jgi:GTP-binding protein LepA
VLNKIDLPGAEPERAREQIEQVIGIDASDAILASAKMGLGIDEILEAIVARIPPPKGDPGGPLRGLVFDSWFDQYRGVVVLVHVVDGRLEPGMKVRLMATGGSYQVEQLGVFTPKPLPVPALAAGEVGFVIAGIKRVADVAIGDTLTDERGPAAEPLPGFKEIKPMVFAGLYPVDADQYAELRDALEKLRLNDSSFFYEPENSAALGFGFRCGFLGLLHMDIVQERLEREFDLDLLVTAPSVRYRVAKTDGEVVEIDSPARLPDPGRIESIEEPVIAATILTSDEYVGAILELCQDKRGIQQGLQYLTPTRVMIQYDLPLSEILMDFYDRLKSVSKGYASLDYELTGYRVSPLVKLDVLVNGDAVDALSLIVHQQMAYARGKSLVEKMRELIPRQMFEVAIQAAIGSRVIARETVPAIRKNVLAKCYGGDISRKRKLLEKQKEGKKRMKRVGTVDIPQEAFLAVLRVDD